MPGPVRNPVARGALLVAGFVLVGIAFVGIVVPLIPTTPLVLLAAYAFSKSSERFDRWLVENRWFDGIVRDWRAGVGFTVTAKAVAVGAIAATFTITILFVAEAPLARTGLLLLGVTVAAYVVTRPTKREASAAKRETGTVPGRRLGSSSGDDRRGRHGPGADGSASRRLLGLGERVDAGPALPFDLDQTGLT